MKKTTLKTIISIALTTAIVTTAGVVSVSKLYEKKINAINTQYEEMIQDRENTLNELEQKKLDLEIEKEEIKQEKETLEQEHNQLKETIKISKEYDSKFTVSTYADKDLRKFEIMTIDEMNDWIDDRAPQSSPFRGNGEVFLNASIESGLDPKYLVAHAALESTWGTSDIAKQKNNYFGIGAYNASPMRSSFRFTPGLESGITEGANWIADKYTNSGQETLNKMLFSGKKVYCTLDDGVTPDPSWRDKIVSIIY